MSLPKLFERIFWHNNTTPAVNETNLNAMSKGLSDVDDRLIELAGTIMEDVPEIQHDLEILEPAIENIDANVTRAENAADNAEADALKSEGYAVGTQDGVEVTSGEYYQNNAKYYAEIANPPIENTVDFTDIITISDAINKAAKDVRLKVEAVQDLHGYDKPWVGGAGKNKCENTRTEPLTRAQVTFTPQSDGTIVVSGTPNANAYYEFLKVHVKSGTYKLTGLENTTNLMWAQVEYYNNGAYSQVLDLSSLNPSQENTITIENDYPDNDTQYLILSVKRKNNGVACTGTIKAMVRESNTDATYESYENICPITGWDNAKVTRGGFNQWDEQWEVGKINLADGMAYSGSAVRAKNYTRVSPSTNYYFLDPLHDRAIGCCWYDKYFNFISGGWYGSGSYIIVQSPANAQYLRFYMDESYGVTYNNDVCINISDPRKNGTYEPYQGKEITIDLGGTRYGATIDVTSGVLTLTHGYKDLGTLSWTYQAEGTRFQTGGIDAKPPASTATKGNIICSQYETVSSNNTWNNKNGVIALGSQSQVQVRDTRYTDATTFTNAMNGVQIVYELATPQTIQLTAEEIDLLYGYNTLFGDSGDISLTYDASGIIHIEEAKLDTETLKTIAAASSDFADFKARIAAL